MTTAGIEMCRAGWMQLMAAIKRSLAGNLRDDPMMAALVDGMERSVPQICDLATAGLAARAAQPLQKAAVAATVRTVDDLRLWLVEHPDVPLVIIPRPLAEQVAAGTHGGLH